MQKQIYSNLNIDELKKVCNIDYILKSLDILNIDSYKLKYNNNFYDDVDCNFEIENGIIEIIYDTVIYKNTKNIKYITPVTKNRYKCINYDNIIFSDKNPNYDIDRNLGYNDINYDEDHNFDKPYFYDNLYGICYIFCEILIQIFCFNSMVRSNNPRLCIRNEFMNPWQPMIQCLLV